MRKEVLAWCLYDLANTAFTSPFRTIFWPLLVTSFLGGNEFQLGVTVALAVLVFSLLIPIIGTISDATRIRMPFIIFTSLLAVALIATMPLYSLKWNLIIAGILIIFYNIALSLYNTLLPDIAGQKEMGKVSGLGMGFGFFGTIISLTATLITLKLFGGDSLETAAGVNATFPVMAAFFLLFSLPLFFTIKDRPIKGARIRIAKTFQEIASTFRNLAKLKGMIPFMLSALLFANALAAIDIFFFLFAKKEIGVGLGGFIALFMLQSVGASSGAVLFGWLADRIGPKKALSIGGILWITVIATFLTSKNLYVFWAAGIIGSLAFGSVLSTSRALFVFLTPPKKIGQFFGYSQIIGKFTGIFGPVAAGWLIVNYSYNAALAAVLIILIAAFIILQKIPDVRRIIH